MKQVFFGAVGFLLITSYSCASSNDGSHGVGNSLTSEKHVAEGMSGGKTSCDCTKKMSAKAKKDCDCDAPKSTPSPKAACAEGDKSCKK